MTMIAGSIELKMLCWAAVLGLVQLLIATTLAVKDQGLPYAASPRDTPPPAVKLVTGRVLRAFHNFRETFVYFAVAVLLVTLLNRTSPATALGAQLYFWSRLIYIPVYASGIPIVRTLVWAASVAGIVMVLSAAVA